jgi:class 3 adenylate cyclase/tetratricopeptide (TPR) repeat protein
MPVCAQCSTENPDVAKFCLGCGSPLSAPTPMEEERKVDTLLFVDMVGSTSRAEQLDPEDVLGLLQAYYDRLRGELERFGGTVEKYIGDAVVCHFGVPVAHEDDAERAVRAGFAVLDAIAKLNAEDPSRALEVRVGIATGETIVTLGARVEEGKGISWGDILNTAARIQSAAPIGGILVGEETYRASRHAIEYRAEEPIVAKGKAKPIPVFVAVGVKDAAGRRQTRDAPLVGRAAELDAVLALLARTQAERRPCLATIVGDAGVGKSRLLAEIVVAAQETASVHWGRCLSYGEGITYWPVVEIFKEAAGILTSDDTASASLKLGILLENLGTDDVDQLRTIASALANLIGAPTTPRGTYSAREISQAELHWGIRRTLELLAVQRPLVLVFEDLHWAEPTLLDLIEYIAADEPGEVQAPILLIGSGRPELESLRPHLLQNGENRVAIALTALSDQDSELLLAELLGTHGVPDTYAQALLHAAGGNPLFLEETVRLLGEGGLLDAEDGVLGSAELLVPTSLQSLIGSRLDGLPTPEKRVAQHASVAGNVFWSGAIEHVDGDDADLERKIEALAERDVVRAHDVSTVADEREWGFKHIMTRDVAYSRVPKWRRAGLHFRFAEWISALAGPDDEFVEIIAYHLEQACRLAREVGRSEVTPPLDQAVAALVHAGEKAERHEGIREADRFFARALELLDPDDERVLDLRFRRARIISTLADHKAAMAALGPIVADSKERGDEAVAGGALAALGNVEWKLGLAADARGHLEEAASIAERMGDERLGVKVAFELAFLRGWFDADIPGAVGEQREAISKADALGERGLQVEARLRLGGLLFNAGRLEEAETVLRESGDLAAGLGSVRDAARSMNILAATLYYRSGVEAAHENFVRCGEWLLRTGDVYHQIQNFRGLAKCALRTADFARAEEHLQQALAPALEAGGWLPVEIYRLLVEALLGQERLDDALVILALARSAAPEQDQYAKAALLVAEGLCACAADESSAGAEAFTRAIESLEAQGLDADAAETQLTYAHALRTADPAGAANQLAAARKTFARIGAEAFLTEIDAEPASASV